jgi:hypothetical protein
MKTNTRNNVNRDILELCLGYRLVDVQGVPDEFHTDGYGDVILTFEKAGSQLKIELSADCGQNSGFLLVSTVEDD